MIERDYIMRMIQQLVNALARIVHAREEEKYDEAHQTVEETLGELFGLKPAFIDTMSAESLTLLLGDKEKVKILARLLLEEGEVFEAQGDAAGAARKHQKSLELYLEAVDPGDNIDAETGQTIKSLLNKIEFYHLPEKYRAMVRKLT